MDKWLEQNWVIKLGSLVIAIMLFLMVNMENQPTGGNQAGGIPGVTDGSRTLEDVELSVMYDEDEYVLTEAPETVDVMMSGPQNVLTLSQVTDDQEIFVDLTDEGAGVHYEQVQYRGFPSDLSISIIPATVRVALQEKQTASIPVDVEFINEEEIAEGYELGEPEVDPSSVDVTAGEGTIEQIEAARAVVDVEGASGPIEGSFDVAFYDDDGDEIDVTADPPAVDVNVPVTSPNKEVPLRIGRTGSLNDGEAIDEITIEPGEVTIFGPVDVLNDVSFIDLEDINLSEIDGDTVLERDVEVPQGIERVEPETVEIDVQLDEEATAEYDDFEIMIAGLNQDQSAAFIDPETGEVNLTVSGSESLLDRIERSDIEAYVEAEDLEAGEHTLPLVVQGPQNAGFQEEGTDVTIAIEEEETDNENEQENNGNEENDEDDEDNEADDDD
ncbi:YbbR-like domain-containing protein [Salisediminibacterium halotolerans]|uniref:YbbR domain-containing protein n=1 Tax=Salisediminibacterium halotolerans TaxID=517425 RepID=A0A1H9WVA9_9BACI|nr:CdaR family protein [Salisediminibacterium haloalkalitolerans]SES37711.1 YbbR domain-containing protein [Salisediminibacterium haloalkalitolerans]